MATQETPSRNRKRRRFLFDDIESHVLSDGDDNILAGVPQEKLFSFDVGTTTTEPDGHRSETELVNATATDREVLRDVAGEGTDFFSEDEAHTNPVVSCEEHFCSVSGASESSPDLTFIQQESILQSMVNDVGDAFPDLIFAMATGGEQPLLQISQRQLHSHPPFGSYASDCAVQLLYCLCHDEEVGVWHSRQ